ncbi:hypothetical protein YC2023_030724 [Brassica napus]
MGTTHPIEFSGGEGDGETTPKTLSSSSAPSSDFTVTRRFFLSETNRSFSSIILGRRSGSSTTL